MRAFLLFFGVLVLLWLITTIRSEAHDQPFTYQAEVVSVYDADTATVNVDLGFSITKTKVTLRFYCINAPEVRGVERPDGIVARDLMRQWMPVGSYVTITTVKDKTGKYGRYLALITPQGWTQTVNARLYKQGMAKIEAYSKSAYERCEAILSEGS